MLTEWQIMTTFPSCKRTEKEKRKLRKGQITS